MKMLHHPTTAAQIESIARKPKGAYLFVGPEGVGKASTARWLTKRLHCELNTACVSCRLIDTGANGDYITIRPQESGSIGIEQVKDLLGQLGKSRLQPAGVRMVVIEHADRLTTEAQNSLLKTIEEPPESTTIVLCVTDLAAILTTIKSRCQLVHFAPLTEEAIANYLVNEVRLTSPGAKEIAVLSLGSLGRALNLVADKEALAKANDMLGIIDQIRILPAFERLVLASKLQESGFDTPQFVRLLAKRLSQQLKETQTLAGTKPLEALERFERYLKANVNGRSAWSRLLLEL